MKVLIAIAGIVLPMLMAVSSQLSGKLRMVYNIAAVVSLYIFGMISAIQIYEIIRENTVFMTKVHAVFLNPFFLVSGAYIGNYAMYKLICLAFNSSEK